MRPEQSPFRAGWWGIELPGHRACDGTYCLFPYETLPSLDATLFHGDWQWLMPPDAAHTEARLPMTTRLAQLLVEASAVGLTLPAPFVTFMRSGTLQHQVPSCTACYFELSEHLIKSPANDGGYLIRFLNDQQDCVLWYLHLIPAGDHGVVSSEFLLDDSERQPAIVTDAVQNIAYCGPNFEEFIYRFWIENTIWYAINDNEPLTDAQQAYVAHYGASATTNIAQH